MLLSSDIRLAPHIPTASYQNFASARPGYGNTFTGIDSSVPFMPRWLTRISHAKL
jgi:hypothetical protein